MFTAECQAACKRKSGHCLCSQWPFESKGQLNAMWCTHTCNFGRVLSAAAQKENEGEDVSLVVVAVELNAKRIPPNSSRGFSCYSVVMQRCSGMSSSFFKFQLICDEIT